MLKKAEHVERVDGHASTSLLCRTPLVFPVTP